VASPQPAAIVELDILRLLIHQVLHGVEAVVDLTAALLGQSLGTPSARPVRATTPGAVVPGRSMGGR
jgi:hypothetical protein